MSDMRVVSEGTAQSLASEQKLHPARVSGPVENGSGALSCSGPVLVASVRQFAGNPTTKSPDGTVSTAGPQGEWDKSAATRFSADSEDAGKESHRTFHAVLATAFENMAHAENPEAAEQKLDTQLSELLDHRCKEFCDYIEHRLNFFYDQTVVRLDVLSDQIVKKFCESLSQQAAATLNAVVVASAQQSKSALSTESVNALNRFGQQINDLTEAHLDAHRKEVQSLSSNLQLRLRRVAYTLEDVGTTALPRS